MSQIPAFSNSDDDSIIVSRREQDRILEIEKKIRRILFGGNASDKSHTPQLSFQDALQTAVTFFATNMDETLVELWLIDRIPWAKRNHADQMHLLAWVSPRSPAIPQRASREPSELISGALLAGRPLRFDQAKSDFQVRKWAKSAEVNPDQIEVFFGTPIFYQGEPFGVLAVGTSSEPSYEHVELIDAFVDYISMAAHTLHTLSDLAGLQEIYEKSLAYSSHLQAVLTIPDLTLIYTNAVFDNLFQIGPDFWGQTIDTALPEISSELRRHLQLNSFTQQNRQQKYASTLTLRLPGGISYWEFIVSVLPAADEKNMLLNIEASDITSYVNRLNSLRNETSTAQERVAQMVALHNVALDSARRFGQDPQDLLLNILKKMIDMAGADKANVVYWNNAQQNLEQIAVIGAAEDDTKAFRQIALTKVAFQSGEIYFESDYKHSAYYIPETDSPAIKAAMSIPMKYRLNVIGVINLIFTESAPIYHEQRTILISREDMWLMDLFAAQATSAIENSRSYLELDKAYQQTRSLKRRQDDLLRRLAHDLKTPLTGLKGFIELAQETHATDDSKTILSDAFSSAERMEDILDHILEYSKNPELQKVLLAPANVKEIITESADEWKLQIKARRLSHTITVQAPDDVYILADSNGLKEVLDNSISNAVKYSPSGGNILIQAMANLALRQVTIRIVDNGIGIDSAAQAKLFQPYQRADAVNGIDGNGLGLYISRQLIEAMNGSFILESSAPGNGSVFALTLPTP